MTLIQRSGVKVMTLMFLVVIATIATSSLASSSADVSITCPQGCRCTRTVSSKVVANCSSLGLTHIPSPSEFDPLTSVLDLSNNSIEHVTRETFASGDFFYLSSLYLDNNIISTLEPFAFRNLASIRVISLRRNRITTIPTNGFSYLSGADSCGDDQGQGHQDEDEEENLDDGVGCRIDLRQNDIAVVDKNAFAWTKQLSILLGVSEVDMTIRSYAFYGVNRAPLIDIGNLQRLTLGKHFFTDVTDVDVVNIHDVTTVIASIKQFTFEGVRGVRSLILHRCVIDDIDSYAFAGIQYVDYETPAAVAATGGDDTSSADAASNEGSPESAVNTRSSKRLSVSSTVVIPATDASGAVAEVRRMSNDLIERGGSLVNISQCTIKRLQADAFRDTNVAQVIIDGCTIGQIDGYVFRGMSAARLVILSNNIIGSVSDSAFSSMRLLDLFALVNNELPVLPAYAFHDTYDVISFVIVLPPRSSLLLATRVFNDVTDVGSLAIYGSGNSQLRLDPDAFRHLSHVGRLDIVDLQIPHLKANALRGLNKVKAVQMTGCVIGRVEAGVFGSSATSYGFVDSVSMDSSNHVTCSCELNAVVQELAESFAIGSLTCKNPDDGSTFDYSQGQRLYKLDSQCAVSTKRPSYALTSGSQSHFVVQQRTLGLGLGGILAVICTVYLSWLRSDVAIV